MVLIGYHLNCCLYRLVLQVEFQFINLSPKGSLFIIYFYSKMNCVNKREKNVKQTAPNYLLIQQWRQIFSLRTLLLHTLLSSSLDCRLGCAELDEVFVELDCPPLEWVLPCFSWGLGDGGRRHCAKFTISVWMLASACMTLNRAFWFSVMRRLINSTSSIILLFSRVLDCRCCNLTSRSFCCRWMASNCGMASVVAIGPELHTDDRRFRHLDAPFLRRWDAFFAEKRKKKCNNSSVNICI